MNKPVYVCAFVRDKKSTYGEFQMKCKDRFGEFNSN